MGSHIRYFSLLVALTLFQLISFSSCLSFPNPRSLRDRQVQLTDAPSASSFISRAYHGMVRLGNYIYIDGGEIAFYDTNGKRHNLPNNSTYTISVTKSWTNQTVKFQTIEKDAPVLNYAALWTNIGGGEIYMFGGEQSWALAVDQLPAVPENTLWKLTPNKKGGGTWSQETSFSNSLEGFTRPAAGLSASGGYGGLLLGGFSSSRTSPQLANLDYRSFIPVPDLVVYNYTTQTWYNRSATGYSQFGTAQHGSGHVVTGFGTNVLYAFYGGETSNLLSWKDNAANLVPFDTITLYNAVEDKWYSQAASGTIPPPRDRFCSVGLPGDNNTFEIFIYGGHQASADGTEPQASASDAMKAINSAMDEVYVLTLPGFNWQKADYPSTWPRINHACVIAGGRQMIVSGGINPALDDLDSVVYTRDPNTNGIGVFDLTEMQWKSRFDSDAKPYITPTVVKDWYQQNGGMYPQKWDNEELQAYFGQINPATNADGDDGTGGATTTADGPNSGANPSTSPTSSSAPLASSGAESSSISNAGGIAGGVIGGVVGLAIIGTLIWFFRFRKQRHGPREKIADGEVNEIPTWNNTTKQDLRSPASLSGDTFAGSVGGKAEVGVYQNRVELPNDISNQRLEMPGNQSTKIRYEMPG